MATPYKVRMEIVHDGAPAPTVVEVEIFPEWAPLGAKCASPRFGKHPLLVAPCAAHPNCCHTQQQRALIFILGPASWSQAFQGVGRVWLLHRH